MIPLAALATCLAVSGGSGHILAGDLAPAFPALAALARDTPVAWAPVPGVQRIFREPELRRLAARWNVSPAPESEICVERRVARLEPARLLEAMRKQLPGARIEILEFSRLPAPEGELEFPLAGLRPTPGGGYWHGSVRYAGNLRFLVWAKVEVRVAAPRVIAAEDLKPGQPLGAAQLRLEMREEFPTAGVFAGSIEEASGRVPRRGIPAGAALRTGWLEARKEIARGETVLVEVRAGAARLELEARAEASGSTGDTIPVRNPVSKKRFLARVEGKGRVSVGKGDL